MTPDPQVILGNSNRRFSGVTSTMLQTLPGVRKRLPVAVLGRHHLPDDLTRGQLPSEPRLPGRAERTPHGAARLRRDAHRGAPRVEHQDGLDRLAVREAQQQLVGVPVVGDAVRHQFGPRRREPLGQLLAQAGGQIGHLCRVVDPAHQPAGDLVGAVARLIEGREQRGEPVAIERVRVDGLAAHGHGVA